MSRRLPILILACCTVVLLGGSIFSDEADDLREQAEMLQRESKALRESGKTEPADQLASLAEELRRRAQEYESRSHHDIHKDQKNASPAGRHQDVDPARLREELENLLEKQKDMEAANAPAVDLRSIRREIRFIKETLAKPSLDQERRELSRELDRRLEHLRKKEEAHAPEEERREILDQIRVIKERLFDLAQETEAGSGSGAPAEQHHLIARRIHHIRAAAQNLKQAEMHDLALKLTLEADALERQLEAMRHQGDHPHPDQDADRDEDLHRMMKELRAELHQLREEVQELRDQKLVE